MALAATWRGQTSDRVRSAIVAAAAGVVCLIAIGAFSVWLSTERINERAEARSFAATEDPSTAVYERRTDYDEAPNGSSILVADWRLSPDAEPLPGIPDGATGWWVSPRLAAAIADNPTLQITYPDASVIGNEGVARADELVAFNLSPDPNTEFNELLTAVPEDFYGDAAELELLPVSLATVALIGIPGIALLAAAVGINSPRRERATQLLATIGAPRRTIRRYTRLTGALAAAPGAAAAATVWVAIAPGLTAVPLVGRAVLPGDLAINPLPAAAVTLAVVAISAAVSGVAIRPIRHDDDKPRKRRLRLPSASWGVFGISTCMLATVTQGGVRPRLFLVGIVCLIAAAPNTLRALLRLGGTAVATRMHGSPVAVIAGRTMATNSQRLTRPLVALMAILVVLPVTLSWIGVARDLDPPRLPNGAATFTLRGTDAADVAAAFHAVTGTAVTSITTGSEPTASVVGCDELAALFTSVVCADTAQLGSGDRGGVPIPVDQATIAETVSNTADIHFVYSLDAVETERQLRELAAAASNITLTIPDQRTESPLVAWILGAGVIALATTGFGLLIALVSQSAHNARQRTRLAALGAPRATIQRLAGLEATLTTTTAAVIALVAGMFVNFIFIRIEPTATFPLHAVAVGCAVVAALVAVSAVAAANAVGDPMNNWTEHNHTGW